MPRDRVSSRRSVRGKAGAVGALACLAVIALVYPAGAGRIALAAGGTLYVDEGNPACSDTGPGTQSKPYCTIGAAATAATAGMSVAVSSGTYAEDVDVKHSGAMGAPIAFSPSPGASVTISGRSSGFTVAGQSWINVSGFNITQTVGDGISLSNSSHIVLDGNHVSYAGLPASGQTSIGIRLSATTDSLIMNNTVDHNTEGGVSLILGSVRNEIRHNLLFDNAAQWARLAPGIDVESASVTVDYNIAHDNEDSGIQFHDGGDSAVAFDNVVYNNGDHGIDALNVTGGAFTGNIAYHNCTTGINVEGTSASFIIENNIAVDNAVYPAYNGISCKRRTGDIGVWDSAPTTTKSDYNLVYLSTAGALYMWAGTQYQSPAALNTATGQEAHGLQADPTWVDPPTGNFHLQQGSPAIDSADSAAPSEPASDIEGNSRVDDPAVANTGAGSRPYDDRGAYEFQPTATDTEPPSMPQNLSATTTTRPEVDLAWSAASDNVGVTGYSVYRNGTLLASVSGSTLTYADQSVVQLTDYTYAVSALDAAGNHSPLSAPLSISTPDSTPPSTPTGVTAVALATRQVNVSWNASTDNVGVVGYTVFRNGVVLTTVAGSTLSYGDQSVADVTLYNYSVDAFDAAGNHSAQSSTATVTTLDYTPPSTPTGFAALPGTPAQVDLSWHASTDNVGVTGYDLYRNHVLLATVSGSTLAYVDLAVTDAITYTYTVDAFDAAGNHSAQTVPLNVRLRSAVAPSTTSSPPARTGVAQSTDKPPGSRIPLRLADTISAGPSAAEVLDSTALHRLSAIHRGLIRLLVRLSR